MQNNTIKSCILSEDEYNEYARHIILDKIGIQGQKRLKQAKILLIGAGGLGCPCIIYLIRCGIGHIGLVDHDTISISNLHRQILYYKHDIHELKTKTTKTRVNEINANCQVTTYSYPINDNNAYNLIQNYDMVIDTSDNFTTRYIVDDTCHKLHKIHIYGAIEKFEGQIGVFNYKGGPRYSDLYPRHLHLDNNNCNEVGVLGVIPGIIGILQATEAIKIIIGFGNILSGHIILYNAENTYFKQIKVVASKKYKKYSKYTIQNNEYIISYNELKNYDHNSLTFIDVRQNIEFKQQKINNALNIPLKEINCKNNIVFLKEQVIDQIIIIYCSKNSRSIIASNILKKYNIQHKILKNGLEDWLKYQ